MLVAARSRPEVERDLDAIVIPAIAADGTLYPLGKLEAHRQGALHLAVSVFVFSGDRLLIQRRADHKYHCGGQWANTCCTHPFWGELPERCAQRRLFEEVGIRLPLEPRAVVEYRAEVGNGLTEHERVHVFRGRLDRPEVLTGFNPDEVQDLRWVDQAELIEEVAANPEAFTPWLRIYLQRWDELGLR